MLDKEVEAKGKVSSQDAGDKAVDKPREDPKQYLARLQKELPVEAMKEVSPRILHTKASQ